MLAVGLSRRRKWFVSIWHVHCSLQFTYLQREDLEFSVGSKAAVWEVKDPLLAPSAGDYDEDNSSSERYGAPPPLPGYPASNGSFSNFAGQGQQQHGYPGFKQGVPAAPSLVGGVSGAQMYGGAGAGRNAGAGGRGYPPAGSERY